MDTLRFGAQTTAEAAIAGIDLHGVRAIVTGGTSGIGAETGRVLAAAGARVTLTGRNLDAGRAVAARIARQHPGALIDVAALELSDPASVRAFTRHWDGPLHLLVNNAGVMALPERTLNAAGHELQFATNHLGHYVLTTGLRAALAAGAADPAAVLAGARIVSLSSRGHLRAPVGFDDIDFRDRSYDPMIAYGQSKTANVLMAVEAGRRWASDGITANAVHPGAILETGLSRHMPARLLGDVRAASKQAYKTVGQGAATSVVVATSPALNAVTGRYFEDCQPSATIPRGTADIPGHARGVAWYALDPAAAERLWEASRELTAE
ncbi:MAG TPA: SDR family NAD(P)-dependent oxidoreductase [Trebonia sp.]|jgi:NAD(P)-dependent dehydrogenase (short-subunit alcohol dehydrogenase family)|nr:SDR family NAD(P)-dependent oxidoreductase [Trebonia sp.]